MEFSIKNVTVKLEGGYWYVSIQVECEVKVKQPYIINPVGVDRGVARFAVLSNGVILPSLNVGRKTLNKLRKAQKALSKKKRGSANRKKALKRVQKLHHKIKCARLDYIHKVTTTIANNHGLVVFEDLKILNMTKSAKGTVENPGKNVKAKSGLNRSILDQGWGIFEQLLKYKLEARGGILVKVPPQYTSQTCSSCNKQHKDSRKSQSEFVCVYCGHNTNADLNAAIVILKRWVASFKSVEGTALAPFEAEIAELRKTLNLEASSF